VSRYLLAMASKFQSGPHKILLSQHRIANQSLALSLEILSLPNMNYSSDSFIQEHSEPLLPQKQQQRQEEDEEETIVLLAEEDDETDEPQEMQKEDDAACEERESRVLTLALYVMLTLQYYLIFLQQDDNDDSQRQQLHPVTVYSSILLLAAAAYLYQTTVLLELMYSTAPTSSPCWILLCQLVPEILIVTSMALTNYLGAEWGFLWLVAGTSGLASTVVVFHALQLWFGTVTSSSSNNSEYHKMVDDNEGESMV